jgi:hypothetical protein
MYDWVFNAAGSTIPQIQHGSLSSTESSNANSSFSVSIVGQEFKEGSNKKPEKGKTKAQKAKSTQKTNEKERKQGKQNESRCSLRVNKQDHRKYMYQQLKLKMICYGFTSHSSTNIFSRLFSRCDSFKDVTPTLNKKKLFIWPLFNCIIIISIIIFILIMNCVQLIFFCTPQMER